MAPPKSFIHVEDFATPKELVDYLEYLDSNDTAYEEYHMVRKQEVQELSRASRLTQHLTRYVPNSCYITISTISQRNVL